MRTLYRTPEFDEFYETLDERVKTKFKYTFEVIKSVYALPVKYVKRLEGTELFLWATTNTGRYCLRWITKTSFYRQR